MGGIRLGSGLDTECVIVVVRLLWPGGVLGSLWGSMHLTRRARVQMKDCSNFFPFLRARANDSELTASLQRAYFYMKRSLPILAWPKVVLSTTEPHQLSRHKINLQMFCPWRSRGP